MSFEELLEVWFPTNGTPPQAFLVDTSEEALLFPDWLKLRMIRSSVESLVDAALKDLDPAQLVLFIQSFGLPIQSVRYHALYYPPPSRLHLLPHPTGSLLSLYVSANF